jgi:ferritin-like metal-binding protein YciE
MKTLQDLFLDELADIYDAENRLLKALPKLAQAAAGHGDLSAAFEGHLRETEGHVDKLKQVFSAFDRRPRGRKCEAIAGLLKESDALAAGHRGEATLNAALVSAAQKAEHYEIASYGCLAEWAGLLGNPAAKELLEEILAEEKAADEKLTLIARGSCNPEADLAGLPAEKPPRPAARSAARRRQPPGSTRGSRRPRSRRAPRPHRA